MNASSGLAPAYAYAFAAASASAIATAYAIVFVIPVSSGTGGPVMKATDLRLALSLCEERDDAAKALERIESGEPIWVMLGNRAAEVIDLTPSEATRMRGELANVLPARIRALGEQIAKLGV